MSTLEVSIAPAQPVADARTVFVDLVYMRAVDGKTSDELSDLPSTIQDGVRIALDNLTGKALLSDVVKQSTVQVRFLAADGSLARRKDVNAGELQPIKISLEAADVKAITATPPKPPPALVTVDRRAYFVPVGDAPYPFDRSKLQIAPIEIGSGGWKKLGLDRLFQMDVPATAAVVWSAADWSAATIAWTGAHLAVDGSFATSFATGAGDAWLWWLTGPQPVIGIVLDDLSKARVVPIGIPLPPLPSWSDDGGTRIPADVTESEVVANPGVYTEDPGEYCKPFKNPERVLGERSFFVTLRVEQPVIGSEASVQTQPLPMLTFDPPVATAETAAPTTAVGRVVDAVRSTVGAMVSTTPALEFVRHTIPQGYLEMLRRFDRGRTLLDAAHPVQWEGDISRYQATTVARGHILEYRMRWRSNGYSLGTVSKTLTLAPRQTRRIQKIEWQRVEEAKRRETTQLADQVEDTLSRERDYDDTVRAHLSEWARGESSSSMSAAAGGFGFATAGFVIGGGGGGSSAQSSSSDSGGRDTSAAEEQKLRDSIRRYGDSLRRLESMVVSEVTQEETVTGTTEVVRNQNYAHALTVIYYQILRHLKIETSVAGVRECLFVPFAITPFTIARAYRWRDLIRRGLMDPTQAPALKYLKDVLNNFANSDIPPGRRSDQPIRYVYGSLFIKIGVDRPKDKDDGSFDANAWLVYRPFLGAPAVSIYERLKALDAAQRDATFQKEQAPTITATWVDTLELWVGSTKLAADFTLATRYAFNGVVRVDFTAAIDQVITREAMASLRVLATKDLTPGSVANLLNANFTYETDQFQRTVRIDQGAHDLVAVETGARDPMGGTLFAQPDAWERRNIRQEMTYAVQGLVEHLNEHVEHYHKVIWWNMDRDRLFMLIDGFYIPGTNDISVASVVERDPIAIIGNSLVFRVAAGAFLGIGDIKKPKDLLDYYASNQAPSEPMLISLPTDGLYAQTVMDECGALEEHFGNTDWALNEPDPDLGTIAPELLGSRYTQPQPTTPTQLPQTIINLQNAPDAPAPSGLAGALAAVQNANAFRDMAGLAGTQANAASALQTAASLATTFGQQAAALKLADIASKQHATQTADQKLASVQRAVDKGLVDSDQAQEHASKILDQLHSDSSGELGPVVADRIANGDLQSLRSVGADGLVEASWVPLATTAAAAFALPSATYWFQDATDAQAFASSTYPEDATSQLKKTLREVVVDSGMAANASLTPSGSTKTYTINVNYAHFVDGMDSADLTAASTVMMTTLGTLLTDILQPASTVSADLAKKLTLAIDFGSDKFNVFLSDGREYPGLEWPRTDAVWTDLKDIGNTKSLKPAVWLPLDILLNRNVYAGGNAADHKQYLLHELMHVLLLRRVADTSTVWTAIQSKLNVTGDANAVSKATWLVYLYVLSQEELFAYDNSDALYKQTWLDPRPALYRAFMKMAERCFTNHKATMATETKTIDKALKWTLDYKYPTTFKVAAKDEKELGDVITNFFPPAVLAAESKGPQTP